MSVESKTGTPGEADGTTIPFGQKYAESQNFSAIFEEGMTLVETTATYLDGDGRADAKELPSNVSLAYATESMRLTTRLMQLASWLLVRRAVNDGEMTPEQAFDEHNKVKFQSVDSNTDPKTYALLPERLRELNDASLNLYRRVVSIDRMLRSEVENAPATSANEALGEQFSRLTQAFGPIVEESKDESGPERGSA